jgi:hypothetical protein
MSTSQEIKVRVCGKCHIEKPLTTNYFQIRSENRTIFHRICRLCKNIYIQHWKQKKKLDKDPEIKKDNQKYMIEEMSSEEIRDSLIRAYAYIYYQAFNEHISLEELERLID